jgi:hypothetical protein
MRNWSLWQPEQIGSRSNLASRFQLLRHDGCVLSPQPDTLHFTGSSFRFRPCTTPSPGREPFDGPAHRVPHLSYGPVVRASASTSVGEMDYRAI